MPTWILCVQALSDVSIICTSSTERELRFHETIASTFSLRIVILSLPFAVFCMNYSFYTSGRAESKLLLGDYAGNVRVLSFSPYLRGPFQSKPGAALVEVFWSDVLKVVLATALYKYSVYFYLKIFSQIFRYFLKGKLPALRAREYINIHSEMISSVYYSLRMKMTFASAEYSNTKKYRGRCPGLVIAAGEEKTTFRIPLVNAL